MSFALQNPFRVIMQHLAVLCVIVGLLAPLAAHAAMGMQCDMSAMSDMQASAAAHHHGASDVDQTQTQTQTQTCHETDALCAGMICFYAMPVAMIQNASSRIEVMANPATLDEAAAGGTSPAMLPKPPKHA
ncbi:hypothetical protein [Loktanella salsilacus]|uniref:hypothetical protein n=1 Tax=Loktanella salsilacus TaxID=195913 RepID=UPI0030FAD578